MTLPARQQRTLDRIERKLIASDPVLHSWFAIFARLTRDEEMPRIEEVRARLARFGGWLSRRTFPVRRRIPRLSDPGQGHPVLPGRAGRDGRRSAHRGERPGHAALRGHVSGCPPPSSSSRRGTAGSTSSWCRAAVRALTAGPAAAARGLRLISASVDEGEHPPPGGQRRRGSARTGARRPPARAPARDPTSSKPFPANQSQICGTRSGAHAPAGPDDGAAGGAQPGAVPDGPGHVLVGDVAEHAARQHQVGRDQPGVGAGLAPRPR